MNNKRMELLDAIFMPFNDSNPMAPSDLLQEVMAEGIGVKVETDANPDYQFSSLA
jgi:hypothetical protein